MHYKTDEHGWAAVKGYLDLVWKSPSEHPEGVLLSLDDEDIVSLFTKERIRMIRTIKSSKGMTMGLLAKKLKRKLPAVERDLKILEGMGIADLNKKGREVYPIIEKEVLIVPLIKIRKLDAALANEKIMAKT